jgi:serine/threonine protein kinase
MYLAPEIASMADAHRGYLAQPVDLWALGCVLYEMLHRRPAFKCEELYELESLIRRCNFGPIERRVPVGARALINGLLVANPTTRLSAAEVLTHSWASVAPSKSM